MFNNVQQKDNLYIDIQNTYALVNLQNSKVIETILESVSDKFNTHKPEDETLFNLSGKLLNFDLPSRPNRVLKTKGIIITDSYNNPFFPIKIPRIDTSKVDLLQLITSFKESYGNIKLNFLPWHFVIEFIKTGYFIFNTRPIDQKFPLTTNDCKILISKNSIHINEKSKDFFNIQPFELQNAVHILIIGDSNTDVYTKQIYTMLAYNCISPILRQWGYSKDLWNKVWFLNIGKKFNMTFMEHCIKS
jgi:hypothetical protein